MPKKKITRNSVCHRTAKQMCSMMKSKSKKDLVGIAKQKKIKNASSKRKADLARLIICHEYRYKKTYV